MTGNITIEKEGFAVKTVLKKVDLQKVEKKLLIEFAQNLGWNYKTKKEVVDALVALQYDENKSYDDLLKHTFFATTANATVIWRSDRPIHCFTQYRFPTTVVNALYEAGLLNGYFDSKHNIIRF